jgi:very-short-patch-repair endonuclease
MLTTDLRPALLVAERQHGVLTVAQARRAGLTRGAEARLVAGGRFESVGQGLLRVAGSPSSWFQQLWLGVLEAPPGSALCDRSALQLHRLPGTHHDLVEVLAPVGLDHRARHSRLHQTRDLPAAHITTVHGLPCTSLARTVFDQAGQVRAAWLGVLTDAAIHRRGMDVAELVAVTTRLSKRGRKGGPAMRAVLAARLDSYTPAESVLEHEFIALCEAHGLPVPSRQVELGDEELIGRVDFYFRDAGLVVEVDGRPFHSSLSDRERDRARDNRLMAMGIRVLRLSWADVVRDPAACARLVRRAIATTPRTVGDVAS